MEQYNVTGMSCAACSAHVEKAVAKVDGVTSVSVSLLTNSMGVEGTADSSAIIQAVVDAGYGASRKNADAPSAAATAEDLENHDIPVIRKRLIASVCILLPLMYVSMGHIMWNWPLPELLAGNPLALGLYQLLLTILVMVINQKFFINGFTSLLKRSPNMDTLVALGSAASFAYSTYGMFAMTQAAIDGNLMDSHAYLHEFYFESAAMILTLITVGKFLEAISKGRTTDALKGLMNLAPQTATLVKDGKEITVAISDVKPGDIFLVRPGESVPVDGVILEGSCAVDESAISGESLPVDKEPGDAVSSATLNQTGFIRCEAKRVGEDTTLAQIIRLVSDAAATKAPIAKVADKVSGIFVPAVLTIAAITIIVWLLCGASFGFALARGISVLVISCPCALGLATPVAIMVGNGMGARKGVLFKTAASLEAAGRSDIIVLDKTGTITSGTMEVTDLLPADGISENELLLYAWQLERLSEHPLGRAVSIYAEKKQYKETNVENFSVSAGNGLSGIIDGVLTLGGKPDFIGKHCPIAENMEKEADSYARMGKTPLFFCRGGALLGIIAVADTIRPTSQKAIEDLKQMGLSVVMLTGDNHKTALTIGKEAGVDKVIAEVVPAEKESVVANLSQYGKVAMVGDGINDAPALTRADTGIAIGAGTDVAIDAADVVLMKSDLADVPAAIRLSRGVLRNIHENLFWAFIYNMIGIPLAAGCFYHFWGISLNPMFGAAAMSLSSFCVVTNALRLNFLKIADNRKDYKYKRNPVSIPDLTPNSKKENKEETVTMKKTMHIEGMMCEHCQGRVSDALNAIEGVSAQVDHKTDSAAVTLSADIADDTLIAAVTDAGYKVLSIEA
ncbi:MAG: heavy metal translocating P-type ATPase [Eubacterium sp.]|nr:heavy metal translocating P-type ATPase [Eubacterium sp.]